MQKATLKTFKLFWLLWIAISGFVISCSSPQSNLPEQIELTQARLYSPDTSISLDVELPATVYDALDANGVIPNPYEGANEEKVQWVSEKEWIYELKFDLNEQLLSRKHLLLKADQLDTYAEISLNGEVIGYNTSAFYSKEIYLDKSLLQKGENTLTFHFLGVDSIELAKEAAYGLKLPDGTRMHSRKAQFQYGWDWGMVMKDMGIADAITLVAHDLPYVRNPYVITDSVVEQNAFMRIRFNLQGDSNLTEDLLLNIEFGDHQFQQVFSAYDIFVPEFRFELPDPQLWMPHTDGEPNMYSWPLVIRNEKNQIIDSQVVDFGVRQVRLVQDELEKGSSFFFEVNGKQVFSQGANIIPSDHRYSRMTDEDLRQLVDNAKAANMNMLRVWGGGFYLPESFYAYCSEQGVMVWQDFMFACAMYPGNYDFIFEVFDESAYQIERLRNYPSLVLWCGNNEISEGWHRWGWSTAFSKEDSARVAKDYYEIFSNQLLSNVENFSEGIPYWESSPSLGRGDKNYIYSGDAHNWWVWHDGAPFSNFEEEIPRFMSEFGFQSFPSLAAMDSMSEGSWPNAKELAVHQKHGRGFAIIDAYWKRNLPPARTQEDSVYLTQVLQAIGMEKGMRAHKTDRYCGGSLYWQLNDCWPVISWSSIDYYGYWKAMHYRAKKAFEDNVFRIQQVEDSLFVYAYIDNFQEGRLSLSYKLGETVISNVDIPLTKKGLIKGKVYSIKLEDPENPRPIWKLEYYENDALAATHIYAAQGFSHKYLRKKSLEWKLSEDGCSIELSASYLNPYVYIQTPFKRIEDNFFHMEMGEKRVIHFPEAVKKEDIKVISLNDFENNT
jgi:beta-mannosidase